MPEFAILPLPEKVIPLTDVGVIAHRVIVIAGVIVGFATDQDTQFAVTIETEVTVPAAPGEVSFSLGFPSKKSSLKPPIEN